jgi:hypothetical protein
MMRVFFKKFLLLVFVLFSSPSFARENQMSKSNTSQLFVQLPDGSYMPFKDHEERILQSLPVENKIVIYKKKSLIERFKEWFVSPFDVSLPVIGNIKNLYYRCEYQVTIAAQEFYDQCFSHASLISKSQVVVLANAYFFTIFGHWLTPSGISDSLISFILHKKVPIIAQHYNLSKYGRSFLSQSLYGLYTAATRDIDLKWCCAAFLYHVSVRPEINQFLQQGSYKEILLLSLLVPRMIPYLS